MCPPTCRRSSGVRDYLTQVVLNLVLNAIDATDEQGRIHVAARAEDGWLVLTVDDDGRGISIADRCRLFQPFFTTKSPRHRSGPVRQPADPRRSCRDAYLSVRARPGVHVLRSASCCVHSGSAWRRPADGPVAELAGRCLGRAAAAGEMRF